ncbi:Hypothetical protein R9X50_00471800 [Acrodontium crateriforme]|uniref:Uncharacterized protein n=1 Tax=Acrodontium crateriforme TaxID=150365 RepID=A0AAQ3M541_9PEZI|nr:Hypothetical protein R9X50_00471800 [Acrodontium crateriforme]
MSSNESSAGSSVSLLSTAPTTPPPWNQEIDEAAAKPENQLEHFLRWRPSYHLMARNGWMNDPCAPGYDQDTGLYHLSFQWNPNGPDWGDIAWGSATSSDLITWIVDEKPSLSPDTSYDGKGVFTGCFIKGQDGSLNYAYTSVNALPIHHTINHPKGIESLSLATSVDGGKTWSKIAGNPILPSEPEHVNVTGFRDPYVAAWPSMSQYLGLDSEITLFGIISGGIRDVTPTTFLYSINRNDLTKWNYIGPLTNFGLNLRPSKWSGDLGRNWEVTNFFSLQDSLDSTITRDFLIMGTEGCLTDSLTSSTPALGSQTAAVGPTRAVRGQLWMSGSLQMGKRNSTSGVVDMTYNFGGHLDHGCFYAANGFFDPISQNQIVWGWIGEDDLCDELRHRQGWSGMLSMPREIFFQTIPHVVGASSSKLRSITSIELACDSHGSSTVRTLASRPFQPLVEALRCGPNVRRHEIRRSSPAQVYFSIEQVQTSRWELDCSFQVSRANGKVGLIVGHSAGSSNRNLLFLKSLKLTTPTDFSKSTSITFNQSSETIIIDRPAFPGVKSNEQINSSPEKAPHTLFTTRDPTTDIEKTETLHIQAWRDNSVMEVFINSRTAISTRLYAADETFGIRFFADDLETELVGAVLYDDISVS